MDTFERELFSLSASQQDVYLDQQVHKNIPLYNIGGYVDLCGAVDLELLAKAHTELVTHTEAFKLRIVVDNKGVSQYLAEPFVNLTITDFSQEPNAQLSAANYIKSVYQTVFPLAGECPFVIGIVKLSENNYWYYGVAHHVVIDGWGFSNWIKQLFFIYNRLTNGEPVNYQPLSFLDLVNRENQYLSSKKYQQDKQYWLAKFTEIPEPLLTPLPSNKKVNNLASGRAKSEVSQTTFKQHKTFASNHGVSVVQLYLTALYIYFSRSQQRNDIVFGLPTHNRRTASAKEVIGMTLSVYPANFNFDQQMSIEELLAGVVQIQRQDFRHQRYPLGHLYSELNLRQKSMARLFDISFNYQQLDYSVAVPNVDTSTYFSTNGYEQIPLTFTICDFGEQQPVELQLDYNFAYATEEESSLLLARWSHIVEQLIAAPSQPVSAIDILCAEDKKQLLAINATQQTWQPLSFIEGFQAQVHNVTNKPAVIFDNTSLTYEQLNKKANSYAQQFIRLGVTQGALVGVCLPRGLEVLVCLLALQKIGAAYVPMDPEFPKQRLQLMQEQAQLFLLITNQTLSESLAPCSGQLSKIEDIAHQADLPFDDTINYLPKASDTAYVIFTSGSTGVPKGVEISHGALNNFLHSMAKTPGFNESDRLLAVTTLSFDIAGLELYLPLLMGGTLILANNAMTRCGNRLVKAIEEHQVTIMQATPTTWSMMLEAGWQENSGVKVLCGGEALPQTLAERLLPVASSVWNLYGPTESTIWSTASQVQLNRLVNIGKPIANTQIYVLDRDKKPLPLGAAGDLYIGGQGLAKGYLHQADLTNEKFIDYKENDNRQVRIYETGDLARINTALEIEYLGRQDSQVKIRGYRIELGDIETAIMAYSGITDCIVDIKYRDQALRQGEYLAAYYCCSHNVDELELKQLLSLNLPSYMIPTAFVPLSEIPLTPNGKKDRKNLPDAQFSSSTLNAYQPANNALEKLIANIWKKVLGVNDICIEQNLFDIGATSLDIVKVGKALEEQLGDSFVTVNLFEFPNIKTLAHHLNESRSSQQPAQIDDRSSQISAGKKRLLNRRKRVTHEA